MQDNKDKSEMIIQLKHDIKILQDKNYNLEYDLY